MRQFRNPRGFTLIELIVVVAIVSTLMAVALDRLLYYEERAEQAMMNADLEAVKMGLRIRTAELMASGHGERIPALENENPMRWMERPPAGYAGDYVAPPRHGSWYFAANTHELIYVPKNSAYLQGGAGPDRELHFRPALEMDGTSIAGVTIVPVTRFEWF